MNVDQLILSATGRPLIKAGEIVHRQFTQGDYHVSIEWYREGRECEPVMCIWSPRSHNGGIFAICLSSIGKYAEPDGGPTRIAFLECWKALPTLGRNQIDIEVFRLLDVVLRHTPDLINCPPQPPAMALAEAPEALLEVQTITEDGKRISSATI